MEYKVKKLDGRYSHRKYFKYCVEFDKSQWGPLKFHNALKWMMETYGYTAEIREWQHIKHLHQQRSTYNLTDSKVPDVVSYQKHQRRAGTEFNPNQGTTTVNPTTQLEEDLKAIENLY